MSLSYKMLALAIKKTDFSLTTCTFVKVFYTEVTFFNFLVLLVDQ